jgi:hypothetical protein
VDLGSKCAYKTTTGQDVGFGLANEGRLKKQKAPLRNEAKTPTKHKSKKQ